MLSLTYLHQPLLPSPPLPRPSINIKGRKEGMGMGRKGRGTNSYISAPLPDGDASDSVSDVPFSFFFGREEDFC
jgi:hypothetical protein